MWQRLTTLSSSNSARVTSGHGWPTASLRPRLILMTVSLSSFVIVSSPAWLWTVSPRGLFASHLLHTSLITATGTLHSSGWPNTSTARREGHRLHSTLHSTKGRGFDYLFSPQSIFSSTAHLARQDLIKTGIIGWIKLALTWWLYIFHLIVSSLN